jgi:hypothetical protein
MNIENAVISPLYAALNKEGWLCDDSLKRKEKEANLGKLDMDYRGVKIWGTNTYVLRY